MDELHRSTRSPTCGSPPSIAASRTSMRSARRSTACHRRPRTAEDLQLGLWSGAEAKSGNDRRGRGSVWMSRPRARAPGVFRRRPILPSAACWSATGKSSARAGTHARVNTPRSWRWGGARARGADVYVTLEPCAHHGRTGPRVDAPSGVHRVVAAMSIPIRGRGAGLARLECRHPDSDWRA
jgi:hypothetical protein